MSLTEYRRKRDFRRTREPAPDARIAAGRALFVVQLHHASRRHYDFRLQVGDALRSWAVPKGPSFDPTVKRLAAEVEDHPLSYASFEGEIPEGEYGGGHVALFDRGVWSTDGDPEAQLAKGHLRFELFGERLKGGWHLVRTRRRGRQPEWLLFKENDAYAGPIEADDLLEGIASPPATKRGANRIEKAAAGRAKRTSAPSSSSSSRSKAKTSARRLASPETANAWAERASALPGARIARLPERALEPQLARLRDAVPRGDGWLHELKWDGYRLMTTIVEGRVRLWSRNAIEWTEKLPDVVAALQRLGLQQAAFDGELIAGDGTQSAFSLLQRTLAGEQQATLVYVLFDVMHLEGSALTRVPLRDRKALLEALLKKPPRHLAYSSHVDGDGETALQLAQERGFEGVVSKRADAGYRAGRGDEWVKVKRHASDEYAVVGYTPPRGSRSGFGALLLARPDPEHGWSYAGRVGSGFGDDQLRELTRRVTKDASSTPSVHLGEVDTDLRAARWFAPRFVVEVNTRGRGTQGLLRQPSLKAIRLDKDVDDLYDTDRGGDAPVAPSRRRSTSASAPRTRTPHAAAANQESTMRLSHPERVVYPDAGYTKQDVADYYEAVARWLLPEIIDRPLSIVRCPDGIGGACFFQKHQRAGLESVGHVRLKQENGVTADYLVVRDLDDLMTLVQFNALELHPWGAKDRTPGRADRIVIDLDPGPGVAWTEVKRAARQVRDLLAQLDLVSFLRSTGGKGLHVVVPLNPGCAWPLVKRFAQGFAQALAASEPERYVAVATKSLRDGRIFVDYLRNGRGATSVASYSLRARPGAPVAMPLDWSELARLSGGDAFDLRSAPRRLARMKRDPWEGIEAIEQDLSRWSEAGASRAPMKKPAVSKSTIAKAPSKAPAKRAARPAAKPAARAAKKTAAKAPARTRLAKKNTTRRRG